MAMRVDSSFEGGVPWLDTVQEVQEVQEWTCSYCGRAWPRMRHMIGGIHMNIVAIILVVILVEIVLAILVGRWLARRAPPPPPRPKILPTESSIQPPPAPPNCPNSACYKRGV